LYEKKGHGHGLGTPQRSFPVQRLSPLLREGSDSGSTFLGLFYGLDFAFSDCFIMDNVACRKSLTEWKSVRLRVHRRACLLKPLFRKSL
jgi:hypothetical protein